MNIALETIDVWQFEEDFTLLDLFEAVSVITASQDILVIGSYEPPAYAHGWMKVKAIEVNKGSSSKPFNDYFDFNREEHPNGRHYALPCVADVFNGLRQITREHVKSEKDIFFDHILAYRPGNPVLPLVDYHDAFLGGKLWLSGHYTEETIKKFAGVLKVDSRRVLNPVMHFAVKPEYIAHLPLSDKAAQDRL